MPTPQYGYIHHLTGSLGDDTLAPYKERLEASMGDSHDKNAMRAYVIFDWFIRSYSPVIYDLAGLEVQANSIRNLPPVTDVHSAQYATDFLVGAQLTLPPVEYSPYDDWKQAWTGAWWRAGSPVWSTALAGSGATIGMPELSDLWITTWFSTWSVSQSAAWSTAQAYVRTEAQMTTFMTLSTSLWIMPKMKAEQRAFEAAIKVADRALAPAIATVQQSALELLDRLI